MSKKKTFSDQISVDQIKAYKDEKIESLVNISYDEARQLDDLDLVYWGAIKDLLPSSGTMTYLGGFDNSNELPQVNEEDDSSVARVGDVFWIVEDGAWRAIDSSSFYAYDVKVLAQPNLSLSGQSDDFLIVHVQNDNKLYFANKQSILGNFEGSRIYLSQNKKHYDLEEVDTTNNGYDLYEIDSQSAGLNPLNPTNLQVWFRGQDLSNYTQKNKEETITEQWTFEKPVKIEDATESDEAVSLGQMIKSNVFVNVKDFGVVGDYDNVDDTKKLQEAINFAYENNKMVWIPNGTYKISYQVPIPDADWGGFGNRPFTAYCLYIKEGQTIVGESRDKTILKVESSSVDDAINNHSQRSSYTIDAFENGADNITLLNFSVDNNKPEEDETYYGEGDVLSISGYNQIVENVKVINGLGDGVDLDYGSATVKDSWFENCGYGVNSNIDDDLLDNKTLRVTGCDFINNIQGGIKSRLKFLEASANTFDGNRIDISLNEGPVEIGVDEVQRVYNIRGNTFRNTTRSYISGGKRYINTLINIAGNTFDGDPSDFFESRDTDNDDGTYIVNIEDNMFLRNTSLFRANSGGDNNYVYYFDNNNFVEGYSIKNNVGDIRWGANFVEGKLVFETDVIKRIAEPASRNLLGEFNEKNWGFTAQGDLIYYRINALSYVIRLRKNKDYILTRESTIYNNRFRLGFFVNDSNNPEDLFGNTADLFQNIDNLLEYNFNSESYNWLVVYASNDLNNDDDIDSANIYLDMLSLSGTLSQLEEGTDIKQRSYKPKDLHDFVTSNSTGLVEKTSTVTAAEINDLIDTGDSYTLVDAPGTTNFIHLDSISMIPTSGSYFDNINGGILVGSNNSEITFKASTNDDTTSIKLLGNILSTPEVNQPCTMKLDPSPTTGNTGKLKIIVRYRIVNNNN